MQRTRRPIVPLILLAALAAMLLVTCGDKGTGPVSSNADVTVTLTKTSLLQAVEGVALAVVVNDSLVYTDTTGITNGAFSFGRFQLPVGHAIIIVTAFDNDGQTLYEGQSEVDIAAGGDNAVSVELTPAVPMVRLAPYFSERSTGTDFESTIEVHNIAKYFSGIFTITFDPNVIVYNDSVSPGDVAWGQMEVSRLPSQLRNEIQVLVRRLGNSDDVPAGATELAHLRFHGIAVGQTTVSIEVVELDNFDGPVPELNNLVTDDQTVNLTGSGDPIISFPDEGLDAAVREALQQPTGPLFQSDVATITELDGDDHGIVNLSGIQFLTGCQQLFLPNNEISAIPELELLTSLTYIDLRNNQISDVSPLVKNTGLGTGDEVDLSGNPLSQEAINTQLPALRARGVIVTPRLSKLSGQITNATTSVPITGANVALQGPVNKSMLSDSFGNYEFTGLLDGTYDVTVSAAGYVTGGFRVVIAQVDQVRNLALTPIPTTPNLTGAITDSVTGDPIASASVLVFDTVTFVSRFDSTDASGIYQFFDLPAGFYQVLVSAETYLPGFDTISVSATPVALDFKLAPLPAVITGTVRVDARTGQVPLSGATITATGPTSDETTSAGDGSYFFVNLLPGDYTLIASADNYDADTVIVNLAPGAQPTIDFLLNQLVTTVSGTIKSGIDSSGVPDASVVFSGPGGDFSDQTDASGFYTLGAIPSGTYDVEVTKTGWLGWSEQGVVVTGASFTANYPMMPGGLSSMLSGHVRNAQAAAPLVGATVIVLGGAGIVPIADTTTTDQDGAYSFNGLSSGPYDMTVKLSGYTTAERTIDFQDMFQVEDFVLSQTLTNDLFRIVLTWGEEPRDLDLFYNTNDFNVYWLERGSLTGFPFVQLDVDDTSGLGPETITVRELSVPANIVVHNYSADIDGAPFQLTESKGVVQVYDKNGLVETFEVPTTGTGFWWNVCDITIDGQIVPINEIVDVPPSAAKRLSKGKVDKPTP